MLVFKIFKVVDFGKDFRLILVILLLVKIFESYFNGILLEQIKVNLDDRYFGFLKGLFIIVVLVDFMNFFYISIDNLK